MPVILLVVCQEAAHKIKDSGEKSFIFDTVALTYTMSCVVCVCVCISATPYMILLREYKSPSAANDADYFIWLICEIIKASCKPQKPM